MFFYLLTIFWNCSIGIDEDVLSTGPSSPASSGDVNTRAPKVDLRSIAFFFSLSSIIYTFANDNLFYNKDILIINYYNLKWI